MKLINILQDLGFIQVTNNKWKLPDNPYEKDFNVSLSINTNFFVIILYHTHTVVDRQWYVYESLSDENILDVTIKIMEFFNL